MTGAGPIMVTNIDLAHSACCVPGTVLSPGNTVISKMDRAVRRL